MRLVVAVVVLVQKVVVQVVLSVVSELHCPCCCFLVKMEFHNFDAYPLGTYMCPHMYLQMWGAPTFHNLITTDLLYHATRKYSC